uniref:Penicillin-binding protein n=2 Tax=Anaerobacillus isosaccharinicus TaxID=1532552 RepID=A0A1S2L531_9BACI
MRISTGFFLIIMFFTMFTFSFSGVTNELRHVQKVDEILENSISIDDFSFYSNSYMYDAYGEIFSDIYSAENRIYLPYNLIPATFIQAIIATEDRQFFSHKGFDMNGITRALFVNAEKNGIEQGGSTITQQLVKNIYLSNERTYNRKLTEILYAYQLEKTISKEKILEYYLNAIYFHNGVYGVEAASQFYFSKPAKLLSVAQVAFLCAIPNNPTLYNPFTNLENTQTRKEWILTKMLEMNDLTDAEFQEALAEKIELKPARKKDIFPDYVTYIHYELEQLIGEKEGFHQKIVDATSMEERKTILQKRQQRVEEILASGVSIYTSLQPEKQSLIYETIEKHLPEEHIQGVAVIIDHKMQQLVAISGGKNYEKFNFQRGFQAFRQPGSSIKPLLVFAPYLAETNASISKTISAASFCKNGYCPQNYGGAIYGNVQIETALKHSFNTPAVRMLDEISVEKGFSYFDKFGFSKIVQEDFRLPAALGGLTHGVSPLEMTNAYTTFANNGRFLKAKGIQKVVDNNGKILFQWDDEPKIIWNDEVNSKMRTLLNKVITEGTGRKANYSRNYIGGKTGTTNDFHDLWFIGLNENYTTGVWIGEDQPSSLAKLNSRAPHLLIWRDLMRD